MDFASASGWSSFGRASTCLPIGTSGRSQSETNRLSNASGRQVASWTTFCLSSPAGLWCDVRSFACSDPAATLKGFFRLACSKQFSLL